MILVPIRSSLAKIGSSVLLKLRKLGEINSKGIREWGNAYTMLASAGAIESP